MERQFSSTAQTVLYVTDQTISQSYLTIQSQRDIPKLNFSTSQPTTSSSLLMIDSVRLLAFS
uniref:Uncharacterized protein n=1 Tax=Arion vulgaris TaxID=1028688 RepID=A0A0B7A3G9_9EUPU